MLTERQADERINHRVRLHPSGAPVRLLQRCRGQVQVQFPGRDGTAKRWYPLTKLRASSVFDAEDGLTADAAAGDDEATNEQEAELSRQQTTTAAAETPPTQPAPATPRPGEGDPGSVEWLIGQIRTVKGELADADARIARGQALQARLRGMLDDLKVKLIDAV